jgi:hypothetical protein
MESKAKVCFITAIYGNYEKSCKKFVKQTIASDFICFTDNATIINNGWTIDTTPYHHTCKSGIDNDTYINSLKNNKHTFNICKYYKQAFQNIPRLKDYDVVIWLDGTVEITNSRISEYILNTIYKDKIITWNHEKRFGNLKAEMIDSKFAKYTNTTWNNQVQPYQDVEKQYEAYIKEGYDEKYFKNIKSHTEHLGVWLTCFIAFLNKDTNISAFLDKWYLQTLEYTTQDQIGFPYVCQKTGIIPFTLPNNEVKGSFPHNRTDFYIKHNHGK